MANSPLRPITLDRLYEDEGTSVATGPIVAARLRFSIHARSLSRERTESSRWLARGGDVKNNRPPRTRTLRPGVRLSHAGVSTSSERSAPASNPGHHQFPHSFSGSSSASPLAGGSNKTCVFTPATSFFAAGLRRVVCLKPWRELSRLSSRM